VNIFASVYGSNVIMLSPGCRFQDGCRWAWWCSATRKICTERCVLHVEWIV